MSSKRQLKRKLPKSEEYGSDSDFEDGVKTISNKTSRKKRALPGSDSENESIISEQSVAISDTKLEASSDENELVNSSCSSDDEPLAVKSKNTTSKSVEVKKRVESSDDDEPIRKIAKSLKSKKVNSSSDNSDDESLSDKSKNTSSESLVAKNRVESSSDYDESVHKTVKTSKSENLDSSCDSSDDEPLATKNTNNTSKSSVTKERSKSKLQANKIQLDASSDGSSDDEPLAAKNKKNTSKSSVTTERVESFDEDESISEIAKTSNLDKKSKKLCIESSGSSDDEQLEESENRTSLSHSKIIKNGKKQISGPEENRCEETSDENEPLSKLTETSNVKQKPQECNSSSSSDDEPLAVKKSVKQKSKSKKNSVSSEDNIPLSNLSETSKQKNNAKKTKSSSNDRIEHMKKYLRLSGIHIQSYEKFFENCKSVKSKVEKLLAVLHENGMKGRPTIEKCKKLKKKIETKKEIAELDTSNIIKSEGRPKRGSNKNSIQRNQNIESSPAEKRFSRLKDIIDSDESD